MILSISLLSLLFAVRTIFIIALDIFSSNSLSALIPVVKTGRSWRIGSSNMALPRTWRTQLLSMLVLSSITPMTIPTILQQVGSIYCLGIIDQRVRTFPTFCLIEPHCYDMRYEIYFPPVLRSQPRGCLWYELDGGRGRSERIQEIFSQVEFLYLHHFLSVPCPLGELHCFFL